MPGDFLVEPRTNVHFNLPQSLTTTCGRNWHNEFLVSYANASMTTCKACLVEADKPSPVNPSLEKP